MENILSKVANLQINNNIIYVVLFLLAVYICFNGYTVYKFALGVLGFWIGFTNVHKLIEFFDLSLNEKQMLFLQILFGAALMMLSWFIRKLGLFVVVFDFVYIYLSSIVIEFIAKKMDISPQIYPYFSVLFAFLIALIPALLAVKHEYSIVIIVMAWIGGFAAVHYLQLFLTNGPIHIGLISVFPSWGWYFLQCFVSLSGMMTQGVGQDD